MFKMSFWLVYKKKSFLDLSAWEVHILAFQMQAISIILLKKWFYSAVKKKKKIRRRNSHSLVADQNTQHTYTRVSLEPDRHRFSFLLYHLLALSFWTSDSSLDGKTYSYAEFL